MLFNGFYFSVELVDSIWTDYCKLPLTDRNKQIFGAFTWKYTLKGGEYWKSICFGQRKLSKNDELYIHCAAIAGTYFKNSSVNFTFSDKVTDDYF